MADTGSENETTTAAEGAVFPEIDGPEETLGDGVLAQRGSAEAAVASGRNIDAMMNVGLNVQIVLGQTRLPISQLLSLSRGSVVELDKRIGAPVDVVISDRLVARGDLVKVGEDRLGVKLTEIVKDYVPES